MKENKILKIYISKPNNILLSTLINYRDKLYCISDNLKLEWYDVNTSYSDSDLLKSDIVIFITRYDGYIGKVTYTEIEKAKKHNIPVYLAYIRKTDGTLQFYNYKFIDSSMNDWNNYKIVHFEKNITEEFNHLLKNGYNKPKLQEYPLTPSECYKKLYTRNLFLRTRKHHG